MKSHELAKKLLLLPDKEIEIITLADGENYQTKCVNHDPWESNKFGTIMIQTSTILLNDKYNNAAELVDSWLAEQSDYDERVSDAMDAEGKERV